ncbi:MAG: hypothetical protein GF393_05250 [Armatimonadia bacterium]|nr:hypothetical protein [Armatimonadia bacterium]
MTKILVATALTALGLWGLSLSTPASSGTVDLHADSIAYANSEVDAGFSLENTTGQAVSVRVVVGHYDSGGELVATLYDQTYQVSGSSYSGSVEGLQPVSPLDGDWFRLDVYGVGYDPINTGDDALWVNAGGIDDPAGPWA